MKRYSYTSLRDLELIEERLNQLIDAEPNRDWAMDVKAFLENRIYDILLQCRRLKQEKGEKLGTFS